MVGNFKCRSSLGRYIGRELPDEILRYLTFKLRYKRERRVLLSFAKITLLQANFKIGYVDFTDVKTFFVVIDMSKYVRLFFYDFSSTLLFKPSFVTRICKHFVRHVQNRFSHQPIGL